MWTDQVSNPEVVHFASSLGGGANIAGRRLHEAMLRMGVTSRFCIGTGEPPGRSYAEFQQHSGFWRRNHDAIKTSIWARKWTKDGFVVGNRWIQSSDASQFCPDGVIVCLHWVARWLDLPTFLDSLPPGTPVVWTLHDFIPVTGGCANPFGCENYQHNCGECPQLKNPSKHDISHRFHQEKTALLQKHNIHLVANSRWTEEVAKNSSLGKLAKSISQIHYGLDLDAYRPIEKAIAREALGLPNDQKMVVGFSCLDFNDHRKGARILLDALKGLPEVVRRELRLVVLGGGTWPVIECDVEMVPLGPTSSARYQSIFYSSLDVFILASTSETFGNVVIEAMACKTPVVAFECGGPRDTVTDGVTGFLLPVSDEGSGIGRTIEWMFGNPEKRTEMGVQARFDVEARFSDSLMAARYLETFRKI